MTDIAKETVDGFTARLKRLEFYLGRDESTASVSVKAKLGEVEKAMKELQRTSPATAELLQLQSQHPSLFTTDNSEPPFETRASVVKASTSLIYRTHSLLTSISETTIPDTRSFTSLADLSSSITDVEEMQLEREVQLDGLRRRSALLIQRWYELGVLAEAECWAEWEGRLLDVERKVRRAEARRRKEDGEEG